MINEWKFVLHKCYFCPPHKWNFYAQIIIPFHLKTWLRSHTVRWFYRDTSKICRPISSWSNSRLILSHEYSLKRKWINKQFLNAFICAEANYFLVIPPVRFLIQEEVIRNAFILQNQEEPNHMETIAAKKDFWIDINDKDSLPRCINKFSNLWPKWCWVWDGIQEQKWRTLVRIKNPSSIDDFSLHWTQDWHGDYSGTKYVAKYSNFSVGFQSGGFFLTLSGFSSIIQWFSSIKFSTKDRDQDNGG